MQLKYYIAICAITLLVGCNDKSKALELSSTEITRITTLQNPFEEKAVKLQATLNQESVFIALDNCKVYRATTKDDVIIKWTVIIKPDFYPWFTSCTTSDIKMDEAFLYVLFSETAIGAGGGHLNIGHYRSKDGFSWERQQNEVWAEVSIPRILQED